MTEQNSYARPATLADVADMSDSLESFGRNLRDWQHEIQRGGVHTRKAFGSRIAEVPSLLRSRFPGGDVADAYLAAYAEWLADQAGIARPDWSDDPGCVADTPWFATPLRGHLLAVSPASFRQRQIFTVPENCFTPRRGRPRVPEEQKREKARARQRAYRARIRGLVSEARAARCSQDSPNRDP